MVPSGITNSAPLSTRAESIFSTLQYEAILILFEQLNNISV